MSHPRENDPPAVEQRTELLLRCRLASDEAARMVRSMIVGEGQDLLVMIVRTAVERSFGCRCRHPSGAGSVYMEDVTCPLHGVGPVVTSTAGLDELDDEAPALTRLAAQPRRYVRGTTEEAD